ncbi:hypothetical protein N7465_007392, partial [Penicillium sp. CMV-2018d]
LWKSSLIVTTNPIPSENYLPYDPASRQLEDSLVVTHPTTNSPACGLSTAERTGSPIFHTLWSYVSCYVRERIMACSIMIPLGRGLSDLKEGGYINHLSNLWCKFDSQFLGRLDPNLNKFIGTREELVVYF